MRTSSQRFLWLILLWLVLLPTKDVWAIPINHQLKLVVTEINSSFGANPIQVGNQYFGIFSVEDELLTRTGDNLAATMSSFRLQIESVVWDMLDPSPNSSFAGFRGPIGPSPLENFASSPGFDVHNGVITGMQGGVFGPGDVPFVDFHGNRFNSNIQTREFDAIFAGDLSASRIPLPATLLLLSLGLATVAVSRKHRSKD